MIQLNHVNIPSRSLFFLTTTLLFALLTPKCHAHNWLVKPHTYNVQYRPTGCKPYECRLACPMILHPDDMINSPSKPAEVWRRGDTVKVCYARNNHHGGLSRLSLVPVSVMNDRTWHSRLTLLHTCFNTGRTACDNSGGPKSMRDMDCGTDRSHVVLCHEIRIPRIYPDGDYVLGHVWYGGVHFKRAHGHFFDYYSCSFIRIEGGLSDYCRHERKLNMTYKPFFDTGMTKDEMWDMKQKEEEMKLEKNENRRKLEIRGEKCLTSATWIGKCDGDGCANEPSYYGQTKSSLDPFSCTDILDATNTHGEEGNLLMGVCKGDVCCEKACGSCGGPNCADRVQNTTCCGSDIRRMEGRYCDKFEPPCIRR